MDSPFYPNDGWMLVSRNFGTTEKAPIISYFRLYDKYRGILRIFGYNAQALQHSFYRASLSLGLNGDVNQLKVGLMTFADSDEFFLNDYNPETHLETLAVMNMNGWSKFDFIVAGYEQKRMVDWTGKNSGRQLPDRWNHASHSRGVGFISSSLAEAANKHQHSP